MDDPFLVERISKLKDRIVALEDALLALVAGAIEEYQLDTGQTIQRVTRTNLGTINTVLDGWYNQLCVMQNRLNGGGAVMVRPGF